MGDISIILTEQNVLSCCIKDNSLILKVDHKYFISEVGNNIFVVIKYLYLENKLITSRNIIIELDRSSESIVKDNEIEALYQLDLDINEFDKYYNDLKKEWAKFQISEVSLKEVLRESSKRSDYNLDRFKEITNEINSILSEVEKKDSHTYTPTRMFESYIESINKRESVINSYTTGCSYLDKRLTERFSPGTITIVFGPSGVGKSTFVRYLVNLCINKQIPSVYYTLEMSFDATMDCIVAQRLKIPLKNFYPDINGMIDQAIIARIKNEKERVKRIDTFRLKDDAVLSINNLESSIKDIRLDMGLSVDTNIIAFIDLLTMISDFNQGSGSKANNYEDAMNQLHFLTRRENIHIVGVVQAKRPDSRVNITEIDQLSRFRPQLEELKNSNALRERARIVLGIYRQKHFAMTYLPDDPETIVMNDIMEVSVLKQNMGALGRVNYTFFPEISKLVYIKDNISDESDILLENPINEDEIREIIE